MRKQFLILAQLILPAVLALSPLVFRAAPQQNADSLLKVISGLPDNSEKADNYIKVGRVFYFTDKDSAMVYYKLAYNLANRLNYKPVMADALYMQSLIYKYNAEFEAALDCNRRSLELCQAMKDSSRIARGFSSMGLLLINTSDYDQALSYCKESLSYFLPLKDTLGLMTNYNTLGLIFNSKTKFDSSAFYYLKAIHLSELRHDDYNLATMLENLGNVYLADSSFDNAKNYLNRSLEINQKNNWTLKIAGNLVNLGRLASALNDLTGAINYYDQAMAVFEQTTDRVAIIGLYNNYGDAYFKQKDYARAITYFDMAIEGYREINYARGYICALGNKASVYTEYGKYEQARLLFDSCLSLSYKEGIMEFRLSYLKNLYNNYFKAGNYQKAFEYETSYYMLKDSLFDIEKTKAITTLTLKYEKEKYQARILNLEKESLKRKNQRNATIFSAIGVSLLVLFVMLYLRQRAVKDRIIAEQKVRQLEEEKKLMAAKFLVEGQEEERKRIARELHDGLGVLLSATKMQFTTIKDMSPENRPMIERATQLLEQATGDVRKISHNMMPGLLTKLGFYEAVEDLFDNLNDSEDLSAECEISGDQERLPENKEIMLYRVIQEMVNNTIKHAQAHNIRLKIDIRPDMMDIVYTDDGKGFDLEKKMESETESIGLKSIQSRVNFLNGTLTMDSSPGKGVIYTMHVPVSAVPAT